jgi:glycosyltransferase involved in cell wall biosynthesis
LGTRTPKLSEKKIFWQRIVRKIRSLSQGFKIIRSNFGVLTLLSLPAWHSFPLWKYWWAFQVKRAAREMGIKSPLLWVVCPPAALLLGQFLDAGVVYQRNDRYEYFHDVDYEELRAYDKALKKRADLVFMTSRVLFEEEKAEARHALYVDHGVDFERFCQAGDSLCVPEDLKGLSCPRIGFIGNIDEHSFDPDILFAAAKALPECSFILVGLCTLPGEKFGLPNIHLLGKKEYEDVASYMAACDVLIMPWQENKWTEACNPVKIKEYLASGRPVVSTWFPEVELYKEVVSIAHGPDEFIKAVQRAIEDPGSPAERRQRVSAESWSSRTDAIVQELTRMGISLQQRRSRT